MFESIMNFFKKWNKKEKTVSGNSKDAAKERLHLVLMQDRANVSADFLELMKQEIIDVIKKYIDVDESAIDVRLTNKENEDGTNGAPALYANIPIINMKNEARKVETKEKKKKEVNTKKEEKQKESEKKNKKATKKQKESEIQEEDKETKTIEEVKKIEVEEKDNKIEEIKEENKDKKNQEETEEKTEDKIKSKKSE